MDRVMVVGASGQLGSAVLARLLESGVECVAFVRPSSDFIPPASDHLHLAYGDLRNSSDIQKACVGVTKVIATACSIVPRRGDGFGAEEVDNYRRLLEACRIHHVEHLVYISAFSSSCDAQVPEFRIKRQIERLILDSGIPFTIFRAAAFMDIYYAVMGSRLALSDVSRSTLSRGFWLTKLYSKLSLGVLENHKVAILPGNGKARHAFVCIRDVAAFMAGALTVPTAKNRIIELGGPEILSWRDVVDIYAEVLGKKITPLTIPCFMLNIFRTFLRLFSPAGENIISTMSLLGRCNCPTEMAAVAREFSVHLTDTRRFLLEKRAPC